MPLSCTAPELLIDSSTRSQNKLFALVQMKKPIMVITNLTLAAEEGAAQEAKLTMMLFNLGTSEKASKFMKVVDDVKPH